MADVAAMQFYRRSPDVTSEMEEMSAEGKKTKPMSAERDAAAAEADDKPDVDEDTRPTTVKQLFMDHDLRQPLFIACALVTIQQFSGINAVRHRHHFTRVHFSPEFQNGDND